LKESYDFFQHASPGAEHAKLIPYEMVDRYALAGTPEEVADRLEQLMTVPGFSTIVLQPEVSDGELSPAAVLRTFAERALGRL
jgi:alkanesulfonate monooxygenase SsuD/methylene tetrahydromethanopterin reductase-like flavin-dependent oxidoreductase (luciferase family)